MKSFFLNCAGLVILNLISQGRDLLTEAVSIDGPEERVLTEGSNFLLTCHGNETLDWSYPQSSSSTFTPKTIQDPVFGYKSYLSVEDADYLATGYYECFSENESALVYVYVFDENHLLAVDPDNILLMGHQFGDIEVPCKPTSPDVNVTLDHLDRPVTYDPKIGFLLRNVTLVDSDLVSCTAMKDELVDVHEFRIIVNPRSEMAPKPRIDELGFQHVVVGQDVTFICYVDVELGLTFSMEWILPDNVKLKNRYIIGDTVRHYDPPNIGYDITWRKNLTLLGVTKDDEGNYTCRITDHSYNINSDELYLRVFSQDDSFINVTVQSKRIEVEVHNSAKWSVTISAHPGAEIHWYNPNQTEIPSPIVNNHKYIKKPKPHGWILEVSDVNFQDSGNYTLVASNSRKTEVVILELIVLGEPVASVQADPLYRIGVAQPVSCYVNGYPTPYIEWQFRSCSLQISNCSEFRVVSPETAKIMELQIDELRIESKILWNMTEPGELSCIAENVHGKATAVAPILVTNVPEGFALREAPGETVEGDDLTLSCAVDSYQYLEYPKWYLERDGKEIPVDRSLVFESNENYSYSTEIRMKNVNASLSGVYTCRARKLGRSNVEKSINIDVLGLEIPQIYETNLPNTEVTISSWQPITWKCKAKGVPEPSVKWLKDGELLNIDHFSNYELLDNNQTLRIKSLTIEEEGKYLCLVTNKGGEAEAYVLLTLKDSHRANVKLIITVVVVVILLVVVLFSFFYYLWKIAKEKKELRLAGLQNFKEGMTKSINQELTLDQQTDLLPYDPKWEFPSSKLKIGKQLGAGAFGVVMKAEAYGIVENEESTTVAVKMVKRHSEAAYIRALVSELKILAHLGKHLNVVNLLGACTKNYMKRELMVIVEFCKFGNAHNYLLSHRHRFIDQINPVTGEIDVNTRNSVETSNRVSVDSDPSSALVSFNTETTCLSSVRSADEDNGVNNNPDWCPNLQGDYKKCNEDELSTSTLVCWGFQVARGMEYLASRRVLHGDLAARNVLIADNNIVKICDFGFAKNIYSHPEYQKTGNGPVPVKWMAIESITRRIFSTQSDVWSFGIVLWEFFSLAKTPYPGFENYESILKKLEDGYRMEKPAYANQRLYDIMLECWDHVPCRRPSFSELVMKLGKLLESNVREHYIELNEPFQKEAIPEGEDYLSMMSPPTYDSPESHYVNEPSSKGNRNSDGYLDMRSSWTPAVPNDKHPEDSIEMKPMLSEKEDQDNDDYLIPRKVPANADCALNPSYVMNVKVQNKLPSNYGKINKV